MEVQSVSNYLKSIVEEVCCLLDQHLEGSIRMQESCVIAIARLKTDFLISGPRSPDLYSLLEKSRQPRYEGHHYDNAHNIEQRMEDCEFQRPIIRSDAHKM